MHEMFEDREIICCCDLYAQIIDYIDYMLQTCYVMLKEL